ncbi:hypothetical protein VTK73DRAFT_5341 [Phialemonium thermophilum]|uniref:Uncharacterized protein n=1 Tax=Phialemonium thermophilum TaxID=223376 RepID=A0ABR3Y8A5_9PEZI
MENRRTLPERVPTPPKLTRRYRIVDNIACQSTGLDQYLQKDGLLCHVQIDIVLKMSLHENPRIYMHL